tara:strand:+ start:1710 stop:2468 length:759 start_codon:yes stop_codon:yes gene_type:complete
MITTLTPIRITDDKQFETFQRCFLTYHAQLKDLYVSYNICDDSNEEYHSKVDNFLAGLNITPTYIQNSGTNFYDVISSLISSVCTKYFLFIIDDVEIAPTKIIKSAFYAMEEVPELVQVKLGHGTILQHPNQIIINSDDASYCDIVFEPLKIDDDIIWITDISRELPSSEQYLFGCWNALMRAEFFKPYNEKISQMKDQTSETFHDYAHNASFFIPDYVFDGGYKAGWINFKCYLYAWWRQGETPEEHFNQS